MRLAICLIISVLVFFECKAQREAVIDSLEKVIASESGELKIDAMYRLGWEFKRSDTEKSQTYFKQALALSKKLEYKKGEADVYNGFGALAFIKADYSSAESNFLKALQIRLDQNDLQGAASLYNNIAIIRGRRGDLSGSLEYYLKATKLREEAENDSQLVANYLNIGVVYNKLSHYDLSEQYFKKAIELGEKMNQITEVGKAYNGLGNTAKLKGDLDESINYYLASLEIKKNMNDKRGMAITYNNLGELFQFKNLIETALGYYLKAKAINEELEAKSSLAVSLEGEAICRLYLNQAVLAEKLALEALDLSNQINEPDRIQTCLNTLALIYSRLADYSKSNTYRNQFFESEKTFFRDEMKRQIAEMEAKYETEVKNRKIREQLLQLGDERQQKLGLIVAIILIIALLIFVLIYFRQRQSFLKKLQTEAIDKLLKAKELEKATFALKIQETERERIAKDLHDHLGGKLSALKLLLDNSPNGNKAAIVADQAIKDVRAIAHNLANTFDPKKSFKELIEEVFAPYKLSGKIKISFFYSQEIGERLSADSKHVLYYVIQELITNTIKHANATLISLQVTINNDTREVQLIYEDDGAGFDQKNQEGFGIKSMKSRLKTIDAKIWFDGGNNRGIVVIINVPVIKNQ